MHCGMHSHGVGTMPNHGIVSYITHNFEIGTMPALGALFYGVSLHLVFVAMETHATVVTSWCSAWWVVALYQEYKRPGFAGIFAQLCWISNDPDLERLSRGTVP